LIIVFGALNMDMIFGVARLPQPGETVLCPGYDMQPGGKGGNQALAALRMGTKAVIVGAVGDDGMGVRLVNGLRRAGVITSGVATSTLPTGCAVITHDAQGENHIIVATGANDDATADQIPDEILKPGHVLLMQMEVSPEQVFTLIKRGHEAGVMTMLNLAPVRPVPPEVLARLDYLIVNEIEAGQVCTLLGLNPDEPDAAGQARALSAAGNLTCIITLAEKGAVAAQPGGAIITVPALPVEQVVDTTGAGDCYCGTLAAVLQQGKPLEEAMRIASVAASLACAGEGTQSAFAYLGMIEDNLPLLDI